MVVAGVTVEYVDPDGRGRGAQVRVLDFDEPDANDWLAVNQFTVVENKHERRPDIVDALACQLRESFAAPALGRGDLDGEALGHRAPPAGRGWSVGVAKSGLPHSGRGHPFGRSPRAQDSTSWWYGSFVGRPQGLDPVPGRRRHLQRQALGSVGHRSAPRSGV